MIERNYIGVSVSELLNDLIDITGCHTEAESLLDEVVDAYEKEYYEQQKFIHGEISREQLDENRRKRRENRRLNRSHTRNLRKNMLANNHVQHANTSPHHIVASVEPRAAIARMLLSQVGLYVDDEANGVFLPISKEHTPHPQMPNAYAHSEVHTNFYYLNIEDSLAVEKGDRIGIKETLRDIADELTEGEFPLHARIGV